MKLKVEVKGIRILSADMIYAKFARFFFEKSELKMDYYENMVSRCDPKPSLDKAFFVRDNKLFYVEHLKNEIKFSLIESRITEIMHDLTRRKLSYGEFFLLED